MAIYPIKMLKDEAGRPFVPLTHVSAVAGEEYTTTILNANRTSAGHYKITNEDLTNQILDGKMIVVKFDNVTDATTPAYLKINNETEYPIYKADGINYLSINGYGSSIVYLGLLNNRWTLVNVGSDESAAGGHTITDTDGNVMTTRGVINFKNFTVTDEAGIGATRVTNDSWSTSKYTGITGTVTAATWVNLYNSTLTAPSAGTYRITLTLNLNNLTTIGREVGVKFGSNQDWCYQYKRLYHTFVIEDTFTAGASLVPQIYVDKLTSTDSISVTSCNFYIEHMNIRSL